MKIICTGIIKGILSTVIYPSVVGDHPTGVDSASIDRDTEIQPRHAHFSLSAFLFYHFLTRYRRCFFFLITVRLGLPRWGTAIPSITCNSWIENGGEMSAPNAVGTLKAGVGCYKNGHVSFLPVIQVT